MALQEQKLKEKGATISQPPPPSTNPFATATTTPQSNNLLGSPTNATPGNASDDLWNLTGNPFVQNVQQVMAMNNVVNNVQPGYSAGGWNSQPPTRGIYRKRLIENISILKKNLMISLQYSFICSSILVLMESSMLCWGTPQNNEICIFCFLLTTQHFREIVKSGWLTIRIMCLEWTNMSTHCLLVQ